MAIYLGIDYGEKNIGLAISDPLGIIPRELTTLKMSVNLLEDISNICKENKISHIVIGLPLGVNSCKDTDQTRTVRDFAEQLETYLKTPVELYDERFTSLMAKTLPKTRKKGFTVDSLSALYILQSYMECGNGV